MRLLLFWVEYADLILNRLPGTQEAACVFDFVGGNRKVPVLTPAELLRQYRGIKRPR